MKTSDSDLTKMYSGHDPDLRNVNDFPSTPVFLTSQQIATCTSGTPRDPAGPFFPLISIPSPTKNQNRFVKSQTSNKLYTGLFIKVGVGGEQDFLFFFCYFIPTFSRAPRASTQNRILAPVHPAATRWQHRSERPRTGPQSRADDQASG